MAVDLMAAVLIFLAIAGSIMWMWGDKATDAENRLFESERFAMAEKTLDTLIRSRGLPENWETGDAQSIQAVGIAKRGLVIDKGKAEKFRDLSNDSENGYPLLRTKLLIGGNDYYFRILDPEQNGALATVLEAGKKQEGETDETLVRRPVVFTYHREGEDEEGEENPHEAIAELTLYSIWQWRQ